MNAPAPDRGSAALLAAQDFERLDVPYLNPSIRTSQAMAWYNGLVVLGTGRAPLGFLGRFTGRGAGDRPGGRRSDVGGRDEDGAQILTFDPVTREWESVFDSPIVTGRDGKPRARDRSIRAALVCQTEADSQPCLYLGSGSLEGNVIFLRSEDGRTYQECAGSGFGLDGDLPSVRAMACLRGRLYTSPTGKNYTRGILDDNLTDFPIVFETADPLSGNWIATNEPGFGDPSNASINELIVFNDHLYAATLNPRYGFQLWKTDAEGKPPYRWHKIIDRGAWLGASSSIPIAVTVFRGALYLSGSIQRQGYKGFDRFGPFPAEMIRVHPDDSWELVTGKARFTPSGIKRPITGLPASFGDPYCHILWRFAEYEGRLYVGTAGWRWMPIFLRNRSDLSEKQLQRLREATAAAPPGEFGLWRTADGVSWECVTRDGFPGSSPHNWGIRELISTPHGLFVAPTATQGAARGGGLELWWGHA